MFIYIFIFAIIILSSRGEGGGGGWQVLQPHFSLNHSIKKFTQKSFVDARGDVNGGVGVTTFPAPKTSC